MHDIFPTNKSIVLKKLKKFCEEELINYTSKRNYDFGTPHKNVSTLSPYINRRFISESDVLRQATKNYDVNMIEKFIQEIFWGTYWRGWLELHPWVYNDYQKENNNNEIPNKTGIKCFDHWTEELIETGYLHNHSRMWFASIWIFTLKKSWKSGANFFKNNLIDWCPASNTLSWRWVAGLQTAGKNYTARADNIKKFTDTRFYPINQLEENPLPIKFYDVRPEKIKILPYENINLSKLNNLGLVVNNNDLSLDSLTKKLNLSAEVCIYKKRNNDKFKNNLINNFEDRLFDNLINENKNFHIAESYNDLIIWAKKMKIKNLVFPYELVGKNLLNNRYFLEKLTEETINYLFYLRDWDRYSFPYTNKGFFPFKEKISELLKLNKIIK